MTGNLRVAVIMAGGLGGRLAPHTATTPKPLVAVRGRPLLDILLRQLQHHGITRVMLALGHRAREVQDFLASSPPRSLDVRTHVEREPRGTLGALSELGDLPERFLVLNADLLTDLPFGALLDFHTAHGGLATVALGSANVTLPYGVVETNLEGHVTAFREKPTFTQRVNLGAYAFARDVVELIPAEGRFGFDDLARRMLQEERVLRVYPFEGRWLDVGRPAEYAKAQREMTENPQHYLREDALA